MDLAPVEGKTVLELFQDINSDLLLSSMHEFQIICVLCLYTGIYLE
jgi:hypothetical protein